MRTTGQQRVVTDEIVSSTGAAAHSIALAHREKHAYTRGEERPLGSFVALMVPTEDSWVPTEESSPRCRPPCVPAGGSSPSGCRGATSPLVGVATHKVARLIAKDPVTSPLRAPFTTFEGTSGEAELAEQVRGTGPRKALGELVTCPFCLGQWVATGFVFGLVLAPRPTRLAASLFTALTGADFLQLAYAKAQARAI